MRTGSNAARVAVVAVVSVAVGVVNFLGTKIVTVVVGVVVGVIWKRSCRKLKRRMLLLWALRFYGQKVVGVVVYVVGAALGNGRVGS